MQQWHLQSPPHRRVRRGCLTSVEGGNDPCTFQSVMLKPDLVMRVIPPTVTITATAPAVPNSQAATALLEPFFAAKDCLPAAAAAAASCCTVAAAAEEDGWGGGGGRASLSPGTVEQCRLVSVLLAAAPTPIFL